MGTEHLGIYDTVAELPEAKAGFRVAVKENKTIYVAEEKDGALVWVESFKVA